MPEYGWTDGSMAAVHVTPRKTHKNVKCGRTQKILPPNAMMVSQSGAFSGIAPGGHLARAECENGKVKSRDKKTGRHVMVIMMHHAIRTEEKETPVFSGTARNAPRESPTRRSLRLAAELFPAALALVPILHLACLMC